jgi:glycine/serine hydroxymethyltransferase
VRSPAHSRVAAYLCLAKTETIYTSTHQATVDFSSLGGGRDTAQNLALADIIMNKNLLPAESWDESRFTTA